MLVDYSVEIGPEQPALELPWISDDGELRYIDLKSDLSLLSHLPEAKGRPELAAFLGRINAAGFPLQTAKCDLWQTNELSAEEEIFNAESKCGSYIDLLFVDGPQRFSFAQHESLVKELCALLKRAPEMPASVEFVIRQCHYHADFHGSRTISIGQKLEEESSAREGPRENEEREVKDASNARAEVNGKSEASVGEESNEKDESSAREESHAKDESRTRDASKAGFYITTYVSGFDDGHQEALLRWGIALKLVQHALVQWANR